MKTIFPSSVLDALDNARAFGYRELPDGTQLFGHVPHVAPDAWFHAVFPGLDTEAIEEVESKLHRTLPFDVEQFLRVSNGIALFSGALSLYGLRRNHRRDPANAWQPFDLEVPNVDERPPDAHDTDLFIGGYRSDGSRLYVEGLDNTVYRRLRETPRVLNRWPGVFTLLEVETDRLRSHFDNLGRRIAKDVPTAPTS